MSVNELESLKKTISTMTYSAKDIRFTSSKDDLILYAILLGRPEPGEKIKIDSLSWNTGIRNITLLGSDRPVQWTMSRKTGLVLTMPDGPASDLAVSFRIEKAYGSR